MAILKKMQPVLNSSTKEANIEANAVSEVTKIKWLKISNPDPTIYYNYDTTIVEPDSTER